MRKLFIAAALLGVAGCGTPAPDGPLILEGQDTPLGLRALTPTANQSLQKVITTSGQACATIERTYLRGVDPALGNEAWDVRCSDGTYSVEIPPSADVRPSVQPCAQLAATESACFETAKPRRQPLNPQLRETLTPRLSDSH